MKVLNFLYLYILTNFSSEFTFSFAHFANLAEFNSTFLVKTSLIAKKKFQKKKKKKKKMVAKGENILEGFFTLSRM